MSTGDAPAGGPEQLTTSPAPTQGADAGRIPLPPISVPAPAPVPESFLQRLRFLDGLIVLFLLTFAFLCGSFKATNSDLFQHLASGRQVAGGAPGVTSFVSTEPGVSQSWLFDLAVYFVYRLGEWGGIALVVLKALVVTATAWFMMKAGSRPGQSLWVPAVFTFLAVLAMSQRLLLQPTVASMLLLAVTLTILTRASRDSRSLWLLPLVCLLWVNLDNWFLLGPATIFLFLLGELIQSRQRGSADNGPTSARLGIVLIASLAACLANPNHVHAFASLPVGVVQSGALAEFKSDPLYSSLFVSPFEKRYFSAYFGLSASGLSYFVLLGMGLLSFGLTAARGLDGLKWSHLLLWLAGAALSAWSYRAIPFFAVVAGPITALNFLDLAMRSASSEPFAKGGTRRWAVSGRMFTAFVSCTVALVSIPGWLQALPHYRRQVGWGVEVDQSLRDACLKVKSWQDRNGGTSGRRWYTTTGDAAYYLAWFCPGESTYVDTRLNHFKQVAEEYTALRRSLSGEDILGEGDREAATPAWRTIFAERGIGFVLLHSTDLARTGLAPMVRMYSNPDEFVPCFTEGSSAIFAWRDPAAVEPPEPGLAEDYNRLAFGPSPVVAPAEPAPPAPREWWRLLLQTEGPSPTGSLTTLQHKTRFDALSFRYRHENYNGWVASQVTSLLGQSAAPSGPLGAGCLLPLRMQVTYLTGGGKMPIDNAAREVLQSYLQKLDTGPAASLYLAVRAARQGLRENPDDVVGQRYLAEAYSRLSKSTREYSRTAGLSPHALMVRQAQVATALNAVLKVNARPEQQRIAHQLLIDAHGEPGYFELRVKHFREYIRLAKVTVSSLPIPPGTDLQAFFKAEEGRLKEMTTELKIKRDQYEVQSANKPVLEKARIAMANGLAETALNLLLRADPKDLRDRNNPREAPGATIIVSLLLAMGRVDDVRAALDGGESRATENRGFGTHPLGMPAFEWFQAQLGAATGDYDLADRSLAECITAVKQDQPYSMILAGLDLMPPSFAEKRADAGTVAGVALGNLLLSEAPQAAGMPWQILRHLPLRLHPPVRPKEPRPGVAVRQVSQFLWQANERQADLWAIRAWLALESGRLDKAREYARQAVSLAEWTGPNAEKVSFPFRSRPLTELVFELAENKTRRE